MKSVFFLRPILLKWVIGFVIVVDIIVTMFAPIHILQVIKAILIGIYTILTVWSIFDLFFKSSYKPYIEYRIKSLEARKRGDFFIPFRDDYLLLDLKKMLNESSEKSPFSHTFRSKEEITHMDNIRRYFRVLLIFYAEQLSFDYLKQAKLIVFIIFIILVFVSMLFCVRIIVWQVLSNRSELISGIMIGHIIVIYLLFSLGKGAYIRNYGDEIIGSYFEKPHYTTKYYVDIVDENDKYYKLLLADIRVSTETEGLFEDDYEQSSTETYITLEKVYLPNGRYLQFYDCPLELEDEVPCYDKDEREWYITLRNEKVKEN